MEVFHLREQVVKDYGAYVRSFIEIRDPDIKAKVEGELSGGYLWPDPLVQLNPAFAPGFSTDTLVQLGKLHPGCLSIFCHKPEPFLNHGPLLFHKHQVEGFDAARAGDNYVLTTGTGSGKSLSYIVPIVDHVLTHGSGRGVQAVIVYPMNALANSQFGELHKYLSHGFPDQRPPVTFARYTGQETDEQREAIIQRPPDILLTNYVMLELILTRIRDQRLVETMSGMRFLVFDELHTYRGRQGADVALLIRRMRDACSNRTIIHVGTSATMAGGSTWEEQRTEVASVASRLFGAEVKPERVIGETLRRATNPPDFASETTLQKLRDTVEGAPLPTDWATFTQHPLPGWIEAHLGLRKELGGERLERCPPRPFSGENGVAGELAKLLDLPEGACELAIRRALLAGYGIRDEHGRPVFAFRLHQFFSKGESVYASLDVGSERHITLQRQEFMPGSSRQRILLPLAFCRECGQEYYVVRRRTEADRSVVYLPRDVSDRFHDPQLGDAGFLYINQREEDAWPLQRDLEISRLPDSWLELNRDGMPIVRKSREDRLPKPIGLAADGREGKGTLRAHWLRAPFMFCLICGVAYDAHQSSDYGKLATLGSEGRSTATTVLSLSTIRQLHAERDLPPDARKLLSFTDNRQDASLQAGHFNDFVHVTLLRSALYQAAAAAGREGITHDELTQRVFDALTLPLEVYAQNPQVEYVQLEETERALRKVLGYYLYRDLKRGWRVTQPNLEQSGLLHIDYRGLDRLGQDQAKWASTHPVLALATPEQRVSICRILLDHMRRELAIAVEFLDAREHERITSLSRQYLQGAWSLEEEERMERGAVLLPRSQSAGDRTNTRFVFLSARGGFGLHLRRQGVLPQLEQKLSLEDTQTIIQNLLELLSKVGFVRVALPVRDSNDVAGYQLNASVLLWRAGEGRHGFHDPIRVPNTPGDGLRTNPFFVDFYRADAHDIKQLEAREHTAQVSSAEREAREKAFRTARLPILFCSPTMELGVDISRLNVVNMRNVPPTPANYAQRSGRAGRSGQPAFVSVYCSAGSPHDQYFFKRPERMVAGQVSTPRLELANEALLQAHVRAIWLSEVRLNLGHTLAEVLDVMGDDPTLDPLAHVQLALSETGARARCLLRARVCIGHAIAELLDSHQTVEDWLRRVLHDIPAAFDRACERWKTLYRAALEQSKRQSLIVRDQSRDPREKDQATRLRNEAEAQLRLLVEKDASSQSDFYSYRYFASEGFLPGYNFPRLPLSAYLPGRRKVRDEEYLSRPRFLAITEFGPRSVIYHEGHRYLINKVILPINANETSICRRGALCGSCGYIHELGDRTSPDRCEGCGVRSPRLRDNLFRMENVSTVRRERINSDEEERFRVGYEILTGIRFENREQRPSRQVAVLQDAAGLPLASLQYGEAATLWRINLGWRNRKKEENTEGFQLDVERGYWTSRPPEDADPEDPATTRQVRVIPYVEDHRNALVVTPSRLLDEEEMASLQAALKSAIQACYQLEDGELAAEPLPNSSLRRALLFYEASEGGAGVLRQLVTDPQAFSAVAQAALERAHFNASNLEDLRRGPRSREDCEAACYDCLLSYFNQRDHRVLNRQRLPALLGPWRFGRVIASPTEAPRHDKLTELKRVCDSELELRWLNTLERLGLHLPEKAQERVEACGARPDFSYPSAYVFIDGPHHDTPHQQALDAKQDDCLEAFRMVIRFHHSADWLTLFRRYPSVFGTLREDRVT